MNAIVEMLSNPSLKRLLVTLGGAALVALNKKLGLDLSTVDIGSITALVVAFLTQSAAKEIKLAGIEAASKVTTPTQAASVLSHGGPTGG